MRLRVALDQTEVRETSGRRTARTRPLPFTSEIPGSRLFSAPQRLPVVPLVQHHRRLFLDEGSRTRLSGCCVLCVCFWVLNCFHFHIFFCCCCCCNTPSSSSALVAAVLPDDMHRLKPLTYRDVCAVMVAIIYSPARCYMMTQVCVCVRVFDLLLGDDGVSTITGGGFSSSLARLERKLKEKKKKLCFGV